MIDENAEQVAREVTRHDYCVRIATVTFDRFQKEHQRTSIPVPVHEIAEWLGFRIILLSTVPDDFSGLVSLEDRLIGVNRNHHEHRRRFSIAHEIGHVLLGHPAEGISFRKEIRQYDEEADLCASELLIPERILLPVLERTRNIHVLASAFLVSTVAMERRLERLSSGQSLERHRRSNVNNPQSKSIPLFSHPFMEVPMAAPNNNSIFSTMVRSGRTTYFVDVKEAKNGNKFLAISENRLDSENKKQRSTVRVFGETVTEFRKAIDEASAAIG